MENPATWGPAEKAVDGAITDAYKNRHAGLVGLSLTRQITDRLRKAGLLRERTLAHCVTCDFPLAATETCSACGAITAVLCLNCHPRDDADRALVAVMKKETGVASMPETETRMATTV